MMTTQLFFKKKIINKSSFQPAVLWGVILLLLLRLMIIDNVYLIAYPIVNQFPKDFELLKFMEM